MTLIPVLMELASCCIYSCPGPRRFKWVLVILYRGDRYNFPRISTQPNYSKCNGPRALQNAPRPTPFPLPNRTRIWVSRRSPRSVVPSVPCRRPPQAASSSQGVSPGTQRAGCIGTRHSVASVSLRRRPPRSQCVLTGGFATRGGAANLQRRPSRNSSSSQSVLVREGTARDSTRLSARRGLRVRSAPFARMSRARSTPRPRPAGPQNSCPASPCRTCPAAVSVQTSGPMRCRGDVPTHPARNSCRGPPGAGCQTTTTTTPPRGRGGGEGRRGLESTAVLLQRRRHPRTAAHDGVLCGPCRGGR